MAASDPTGRSFLAQHAQQTPKRLGLQFLPQTVMSWGFQFFLGIAELPGACLRLSPFVSLHVSCLWVATAGFLGALSPVVSLLSLFMFRVCGWCLKFLSATKSLGALHTLCAPLPESSSLLQLHQVGANLLERSLRIR